MTEVDEFIGDFLEHKAEYDPRKAHEYYMRTRKLKGKSGERVPTKEAFKPKPVRQLQKNETETAQRRQLASEKLRRARAKADGMPEGKKKSRLQRRLDKLEKQLKGAYRSKTVANILPGEQLRRPTKSDHAKSSSEHAKRVSDARDRVVAARKKAKKHKNRNFLERKLDSVDRKLDSAHKAVTRNPFAVPGKKITVKKSKAKKAPSLHNPFAGAKIGRS